MKDSETLIKRTQNRPYGILSDLYSKHFDVPNKMSVFETDFPPDFSAEMMKNGKNSVDLTVFRPIHCVLRDRNRCDQSVSNCDNANFLTLVFYGKMLSSQFGSSPIFRKFVEVLVESKQLADLSFSMIFSGNDKLFDNR